MQDFRYEDAAIRWLQMMMMLLPRMMILLYVNWPSIWLGYSVLSFFLDFVCLLLYNNDHSLCCLNVQICLYTFTCIHISCAWEVVLFHVLLPFLADILELLENVFFGLLFFFFFWFESNSFLLMCVVGLLSCILMVVLTALDGRATVADCIPN